MPKPLIPVTPPCNTSLCNSSIGLWLQGGGGDVESNTKNSFGVIALSLYNQIYESVLENDLTACFDYTPSPNNTNVDLISGNEVFWQYHKFNTLTPTDYSFIVEYVYYGNPNDVFYNGGFNFIRSVTPGVPIADISYQTPFATLPIKPVLNVTHEYGVAMCPEFIPLLGCKERLNDSLLSNIFTNSSYTDGFLPAQLSSLLTTIYNNVDESTCYCTSITPGLRQWTFTEYSYGNLAGGIFPYTRQFRLDSSDTTEKSYVYSFYADSAVDYSFTVFETVIYGGNVTAPIVYLPASATPDFAQAMADGYAPVIGGNITTATECPLIYGFPGTTYCPLQITPGGSQFPFGTQLDFAFTLFSGSTAGWVFQWDYAEANDLVRTDIPGANGLTVQTPILPIGLYTIGLHSTPPLNSCCAMCPYEVCVASFEII